MLRVGPRRVQTSRRCEKSQSITHRSRHAAAALIVVPSWPHVSSGSRGGKTNEKQIVRQASALSLSYSQKNRRLAGLLWARRVSNLRPLACEASALPLSYAPWTPESIGPREQRPPTLANPRIPTDT